MLLDWIAKRFSKPDRPEAVVKTSAEWCDQLISRNAQQASALSV